MKKLIFTLSLTLIPFYTFAYEGTISQSGSCGATDADCHYDLYDDGHLEISGTGEMTDWSWRDGNAAPWAPDNAYGISPVTSVNVDGITKIGKWAFLWCRELSDVKISDTVKEIAGGAFEQTRDLKNIVIPSSVDKLGWYAFSNSGLENIIIEGTPELDSTSTSLINTGNATIYCQESIGCENSGNGSGGTIIPYEKQGGVFILDGQYYLSGTDMVGRTNECPKELNECKRDVLEAKGICQGSSCDTFIQSDGQYMLKFGGKTYQDINALLKGDYDRRRIYTIEEANFVSGDKNRVSITYR
ncbi:MAG: leucine-rich repeat domain-containing protein [Alphaproteobacteria bacterium]|nr:leucine-rich repeat domain-containing protein [Alphaproteobacteria bacterium]